MEKSIRTFGPQHIDSNLIGPNLNHLQYENGEQNCGIFTCLPTREPLQTVQWHGKCLCSNKVKITQGANGFIVIKDLPRIWECGQFHIFFVDAIPKKVREQKQQG